MDENSYSSDSIEKMADDASDGDSINSDENSNSNDFNTIQNLIDQADFGDTIDLEEKTYFGSGSSINITKNLTIKGSNTILNASGKSNIFNIPKNVKAVFIGLTLTEGYTDSDGGAICNEGILDIYNMTISNNHANGGAVRVSSGAELNAYNTRFESNYASVGGAIDSYECFVTINNCTFIANNCTEGGIYNRYGDCYIYDSIFMNNTAQRGGGVYNNKGNMRIYRCQFYYNHAGHLGGAIKSFGNAYVFDSIIMNNTGYQGGGLFVSQNRLWVSNCTIENNYAYQGGGLFADVGGLLKIRNCDIINNSAEEGGGIHLYDGKLDIQNSRLINNSADTLGGALFFNYHPYDYDIKNLVFEGNHAKTGGAIYAENSLVIKITNAAFSNNSAENEGGAIYNKGNLTLEEIAFTSNNASGGGAVYSTNILSLKKASASKNKASDKGGVIYCSSDLFIYDLNSESNEAGYGGAIYAENGSEISNSLFTSNKASQGGAVYACSNLTADKCEFTGNQISHSYGTVFLLSGNSSISNSLFQSNKGSDEGGCIFISGASVYINNTQFMSNTAVSYGAGINNDGELTIENSVFDKNRAWGASAIDNAGKLTVINSKFTNNKATLDGGAITNRGELNITGSVFENNQANGEGGAILTQRGMNITHSIICNNYDKDGYGLFVNTWDEVSLSNNWWGSNSPDFEKILNINISDDFNWIVMSFTNSTPLIQHRTSNLAVTFDNVINKDNLTSKLDSPELLAEFSLNLSLNNYMAAVSNGIFSSSFSIPKINSITAKVNNQSISLSIIQNPYAVCENKNIAEDYSGKTTFKARIVDSFGVSASNVDVVLKISGKSYSIKTDKNGYFAKTFSLTHGKYTIYIICDGKTLKNTIKINKVLKAKNASKKKAKKIKYSASLKTSKGKAIVGKKISFKIKGKTYSAKTNKKGIATVKFKNLKVGKYKITVKYLNSKVKTTLKVKK